MCTYTLIHGLYNEMKYDKQTAAFFVKCQF